MRTLASAISLCALAACAAAPVVPTSLSVQVESKKAEVTTQSLTTATVTVSARALAPSAGVVAKVAHWELVFDGAVIAHGEQKLEQPIAPGETPTELSLSGAGTTAVDAAAVQRLAEHKGGFPIALRGTIDFAGPDGANGKAEFAKATTLREPRIPQVVVLDAGASHYDDGHVNLTFNVALDNPNPFPVPVATFVYKIAVNGTPVGDGEAGRGTEIPASSKKVFELTAELQPGKFPNLDRIYKENSMKYRLNGTLDLTLVKFDVELGAPLNFTR
jgi:LEA14-like dessication related protein